MDPGTLWPANHHARKRRHDSMIDVYAFHCCYQPSALKTIGNKQTTSYSLINYSTVRVPVFDRTQISTQKSHFKCLKTSGPIKFCHKSIHMSIYTTPGTLPFETVRGTIQYTHRCCTIRTVNLPTAHQNRTLSGAILKFPPP